MPACPCAPARQLLSISYKRGSFPSLVDAFVVLVFLAMLCLQLPILPGPPCQPCPHSLVIGWYNYLGYAVMSRSAGSVPIL